MNYDTCADGYVVSELEKRHIIEMIEQALVEMEESEDISQGSIDGLIGVLQIYGVKYES